MSLLFGQFFTPFRITLISCWFGSGIVLAYLFAVRPAMPALNKMLIGMAMFLCGPVYFPAWLLTGVIVRMGDGASLGEALRDQLSADRGDDDEAVADPLAETFVLLDKEGRNPRTEQGRGPTKGVWLALTKQLLNDAVLQTASDILIHPSSETEFNVRYRVNGTLRSVRDLSEIEGKSVVNSIKAISGLNIAERRRPQDGAFSAQTPRGSVSFRVATAGVLHGEKVSVRILDQSASEYNLDDVGLSQSEMEKIARALKDESGMILVCGPTGSGKSSTVHAMLRAINRIERNVITLEDPVEYVLPNASQIEINAKAGITFASALRSVLRQDPDVISVGEIRDSETAEIALQAAQTGHLVFATLHSGNNMASLLRLIDLGTEAPLIASAVNLIISQRLVRRLCDHCKTKEEFTEAQKQSMWRQHIDPECLFTANGCEHCHRTGFSSRTGVFDITVMDSELRTQVAKHAISTTSESHTAHNMSPIQVRGAQLALAGQIPWSEVLRLGSSSD